MEEKILIKSISSKKTKQFFMGIIIALIIISIVSLILAISVARKNWASSAFYYYGSSYYKCEFCDELGKYNDLLSHILESHSNNFYLDIDYALVWFILHWAFIFLTGIFYLIYLLISRCNLVISEKNISGNTFLGRKVVLPIHMVSAYSISKIFSVVAITTASGIIKFYSIGNYKEIADVLQQLLNERQKRTETQEYLISKQKNTKNLDDLVKLKHLLDEGIITKEEYDVKKKEILEL